MIKFFSQALANTYGTGLISYRGIYTYIQGDWTPLPLISYGMVLESPGKSWKNHGILVLKKCTNPEYHKTLLICPWDNTIQWMNR